MRRRAGGWQDGRRHGNGVKKDLSYTCKEAVCWPRTLCDGCATRLLGLSSSVRLERKNRELGKSAAQRRPHIRSLSAEHAHLCRVKGRAREDGLEAQVAVGILLLQQHHGLRLPQQRPRRAKLLQLCQLDDHLGGGKGVGVGGG